MLIQLVGLRRSLASFEDDQTDQVAVRKWLHESNAPREARDGWDDFRESLLDVVGLAIGEEIADLRKEFQSEMRTSLRIAILEQAGLCPHVRGVWQTTENYAALDICMKDGAAWIAKHSNPGPLPGEGWQILSCKGERGKIGPIGQRGETGPPGPRGEPGMNLNGWLVDGFRITPILGGGQPGPMLDLRPLFQRFVDEQAGAATAKAVKAAAHHHVHGQPPLVQLIHGPPPAAPEEESA